MTKTSEPHLSRMRIVVIGAGIAGIASALALADDKRVKEVTLLEARKRIGGRVGSVVDPVSQMEFDNCQHACFRVYERFLQLLGRAGAQTAVKLQTRTNLPFTLPEKGISAILKDGRLSPPNHMLGSILKFPFLAFKDKAKMRKAVSAFAKMNEEERLKLDEIPFIEWLENNGQTKKAIDRFWRFFVLAALNMQLEDASTAVCALLFKRGLFGDPHAFDVGAFQDHLSGAIDSDLSQALEESGVELRCSTSASELIWQGGKCTGVRCGDENIFADWVVMATPHHIARKFLSHGDASGPAKAVAGRLSNLDYTALIGLHAIYDEPKAPEDFTFSAIVDEPVIQMIFNRNSELAEENKPAENKQWLSVPVSFADPFMQMSDDELRQDFEKVVNLMWPQSTANLERFFVVRTKRATCAFPTGSHPNRPDAGDAGEGISLAGDYTSQGWPSTMEGAARSGLQAAALVLSRDWNPDENWPEWPPYPTRKSPEWIDWACE